MVKKLRTKNLLLLALCLLYTADPLVWAAETVKSSSANSDKTLRQSNRLVVRFKANDLPPGLSVAQINESLRKPLTTKKFNEIQAAAGMQLTEHGSLSNGAHLLSMPGSSDKVGMKKAIAAIRALANVEYVEEDRIMNIQAAPNDEYYGNLWGLHPVARVATPAPGGTGSYGADFESAWNINTGTGVVVAVVDTGITSHPDIVGSNGNLVSAGYDFISDCRMRNTCAAKTSNSLAVTLPSPDATDLGDYITAQDIKDNPTLFPGPDPYNSSWHGTHVAGTIAALGNNAIGVIGGAHNARILPVRALGKGGGYMTDIVEGMRWAAGIHPTIPNPNPANIINLSLSGEGPCSTTEQNAINAIVAAGVVVVVAAGNGNQDVANSSPANCNNVISVAAIAKDGSRGAYSNYSGSSVKVTLAAPGGSQSLNGDDRGIYSTLNTGLTKADLPPSGYIYVYYQGTSMAVPHVSAAVALMKSRNSALTPVQIKNILSSPSSLTSFPTFVAGLSTWDCALNQSCGAGILNAQLAVQNSITPLIASVATMDFGSIPVNDTVNQTVTLTNISLDSVVVGNVTVTGSHAAYFKVATNTCDSTTIAPSGTCQITLNFAPTETNTYIASLSIPTNVTDGTTIVGLAGIAGAMLISTTPNVTAATIPARQSTSVTLSFKNPNSIAVGAGVVSLSHPTIMATSVDNCSNVMLAAGATCDVAVTITPAVAGDYSGTASLGLAGGGAPAVATISGSASAALLNSPAAASNSFSGGGGGCSVMAPGTNADFSLLLAMLVVMVYCGRGRGKSADSATPH